MLEAYKTYLELLDNRIAQYFEQSKDFVFCKEGCSSCCEKGQYPCSQLEFTYILQGSLDLKPAQLAIIDKNIAEIKKQQRECEDRPTFTYRCPFLIENRCSVYHHRAFICRTHGLAFYIDENVELKLPGCFHIGLNYSNVFELNEKGSPVLISRERCEQLGIEEDPLAYNLGLKTLLYNEDTQRLKLKFGDNKALIDWLEEGCVGRGRAVEGEFSQYSTSK